MNTAALSPPRLDDTPPESPDSRARRASPSGKASGRRKLVDPTTCERDYSAAEVEFMQAMKRYKDSSGRMFPTWSETLEVLRGLGYLKRARPASDRAVRVASPAPPALHQEPN